MVPVIAIVGRPNVGKSTLFNVLTQRRDALVANQPGLTRDRRFGHGKLGNRPYIVVDTGGLSDAEDEIAVLISQQALRAVKEADRVLFMVDAHSGLTAEDERIARELRQFGKPIFLVVNKVDGHDEHIVSADFHALGFGHCLTIAAAHRRGVHSMIETLLEDVPWEEEPSAQEEEETGSHERPIKVAIIGRPNVGKSTLINRILGEERQLTYDMPGTTRDSIAIPFERDGQAYIFIDTAGVRRRSKVHETVEKFSAIKALQAIEETNVVVMLFDAREGVTDQDVTLLGFALERGRALVLAVNKWDGLSEEQREQARSSISRKLHFIDFAKLRFISALHGTNVGHLFADIQNAWQAAIRHISTPRLNQILQDVVENHAPPQVRGRRIKLRYIHQGGQNPPLFIIHGNQLDALPGSYKRYLINTFREVFRLWGTPVQFSFRQGENPFANRKPKLTSRQAQKKRRLMRHVKKNK